MTMMPVASGMDIAEDSAYPFPLSQGAQDVSAYTGMRDPMQAAIDEPTLFDWDGGGSKDYPLVVDIGTSVPNHGGPMGVGEAAKGTPATASGVGGGLTQMTPMPYG